MDIKNFSVCIVGKDKDDVIKQCMESCMQITDRISYIALDSNDNSIQVAEKSGVYVVNGKSFKEVPETLQQFHMSKWVLFLRPDEKIVLNESKARILQLLERGQATGYSLNVKTPVSTAMLDDYRWIKIPGKPNRYSPESLIVPKIEIRLVQRQHLAEALNLMISFAPDKVFSFSSKVFKNIEIHSIEGIENVQQEINSNDAKELEMKFLRGDISLDAVEDYGMWELGDGFLGYNVLKKEDLGRYYRGLAMGFGSERMYLAMLGTRIQYGKFEEAKAFFDAWLEKWGVFDTAEPYKMGGIIFMYLFQHEKAVALFYKHLDRVAPEQAAEGHLLLARSLLLLDKKDQAIEHFQKALNPDSGEFEKNLIRTIEDSNWKPPRLSVCMIAKDEQAAISKALDSLTGIVDEIIVVDTGSKDQTKEIVQKYNATIVSVDWEDDFSKARNEGLRHATGDYILCLDADEYIHPRERIKLALFKMILPAGRDVAFRVKINSEDEDEEMSAILRVSKLAEDYAIRLVPARQEICFQGPVFESMDRSIADLGINVATTETFQITHSAGDRKWRDARKEPAVEKSYHNNPNPETALKAALYHLNLGNSVAALKWLELAPCDNPRLWMKIITLYCRLGQAKDAAVIIKKALRAFPDSLDFYLAKAELYFAEGEYNSVYETLGPHMEKIEKEMGREDRATAAYLYGMALLETGNLAEGVESLSDARELDSWNMRYKLGGLYALTLAEAWENAVDVLSGVLHDENLYMMDTIHDFADLGIIFKKLARHFEINDRMEASKICQKIFLNITQNKISDQETIEKMIQCLDTGDMGKEQVESGYRNI